MRAFVLVLITICVFAQTLSGQSNEQIRTYGILSVTEYTIEYDGEGNEIKYKSAFEKFNKDGKTIEEVEWKDDGRLEYRHIEKYEKGEEVEQIEDYPMGEKGEDPFYKRTERTFHRGDEVEQREYDREGNLTERTTYEYNKMGDLALETKYEADGEVDEIIEYQYDKKGLLIAEIEKNGKGEIKEKKVFEYAFR